MQKRNILICICVFLAISAAVCFCGCSSEKTADQPLKLSGKYESIANINFKIPASWSKVTDGDQEYLEYMPARKDSEDFENFWVGHWKGESFKSSAAETWKGCKKAEQKGVGISDVNRKTVKIKGMHGVVISYTEGKDSKSKISKMLILKTSAKSCTVFSIYVSKEKEDICAKIFDSIKKKSDIIEGTAWKFVGNKNGNKITYYKKEGLPDPEQIIKFKPGGIFTSTMKNGTKYQGKWKNKGKVYRIEVSSDSKAEMEAKLQGKYLILGEIVPDKYKDIPQSYAVFKKEPSENSQ